jgi:hypothetical protein
MRQCLNRVTFILLFIIFQNVLAAGLASKVRLFADNSVQYRIIKTIDNEKKLQEGRT